MQENHENVPTAEPVSAIKKWLNAAMVESVGAKGNWFATIRTGISASASRLYGIHRSLILVGAVAIGGYLLYQYPPYRQVDRDEIGLRINQWTGSSEQFRESQVLVIPGVHEMRIFSSLDQVYRPAETAQNDNGVAFKSIEGVALDVNASVRYAVDPDNRDKVLSLSRLLPKDINAKTAEPIIQDVLYKALSRLTVREIVSADWQDIQEQISLELQQRLSADGIKLKLLAIGKVDLPASLLEQVYRPSGNNGAAFKSIEGIALDVNASVRYAVDPDNRDKVLSLSRLLPKDINAKIAEPIIQEVLYKALSRLTIREIASADWQDIQEQIAPELQQRLSADGIKLKSLAISKVDLPASLLDQMYRPLVTTSGNSATFQSIEGVSLGVDISVRYTVDLDNRDKILSLSRLLPIDINGKIVEPIIQDILYKTLSRFTVREIFSAKRQDIQEQISQELQRRLIADGIKLKLLTIGEIDLPAKYKAGMEKLFEAELNAEQMRYTLELKDKQVRESELEAQAEKVRREKAAETAGAEQIIAAKAQAEAMQHILPFKEKQIQQRALEAEAEKVARLKRAEADAQARLIEAEAEANSRKKLADAEVYRQDQIGKVSSEQLARDGALLAKNPLLIQKTLADKLSDKISVIIAPPSSNGGFIGENLIGRLPASVSTTGSNNGEER